MTDQPLTTQTYTCEGCGATFTGDAHTAFMEGWDTPERFMSHCTCPKCPITSTLWWEIVTWQHDHPGETFPATQEQIDMLLAYNRLFDEANPGVLS